MPNVVDYTYVGMHMTDVKDWLFWVNQNEVIYGNPAAYLPIEQKITNSDRSNLASAFSQDSGFLFVSQ